MGKRLLAHASVALLFTGQLLLAFFVVLGCVAVLFPVHVREEPMIDRGMLEYVINRIRPQIQADGGDVEVTDVDDEDGIVYVALRGACVDCPLSALTLSQGIESVLCEHVPGVKHVLPDMEKTVIHDPETDEDIPFENSIHVTKIDENGNIIEESTM